MSLVDVRKKMAEQRAQDERQQCRICNTVTAWETLSDHGGRCYPCYAAYCRAVPPAPKLPAFADSPRRWAYLLQWREQRGERLSPVQKTLWREALQSTGAQEDRSDG